MHAPGAKLKVEVSTARTEQLFRDYRPLALSISRRAATALPHLADDFLSAAMVALWHAAETHRDGETLFGTYARVCIERDVRAVIVHHTRGRRDWRRVQHVGHDRDANPLAELIEARAEDVKSEPEATTLANELLAMLSREERIVIELHVMGAATMREVGEHLGVSRQRVHQLLTRALERLRNRPLLANRLARACG
jgi:RNA polymerase sigma factor (sigma-70 family)